MSNSVPSIIPLNFYQIPVFVVSRVIKYFILFPISGADIIGMFSMMLAHDNWFSFCSVLNQLPYIRIMIFPSNSLHFKMLFVTFYIL